MRGFKQTAAELSKKGEDQLLKVKYTSLKKAEKLLQTERLTAFILWETT